MEIELDLPLVHGVTAHEYTLASVEIATQGAIRAYEASRERHDSRLAAAPDAHSLACKAGCYWCCYFSVDLRPVEVFAILEFVAQLDPHEQERIRSEILANHATLLALADSERARRNIKCPFLSGGRCCIYTARPQTCRNYHATDAAGCKLSYEQPDNHDIDPEFAPLTFQIGGAHVDAFSKALHDAGYDCDAYELNIALYAAMNDPASRTRFEAKGRPFAQIEGNPVPLEFIDE